MGLSDEERLQKIYFSIWRMTRDTKLRLIRDEYPRLTSLVEQLWPKCLGGKGNGLYWLLGSGVDSEVMTDPTLFNIAIAGNRSRGRPDSLDEMRAERRAEVAKMPEGEEKKKALARQRRLDYQTNFHPQYDRILHGKAPALGVVYELFEECEHIRYAMNRYRDKLSASLEGLDVLVSQILGECFNLFTSDTRFRAAWYECQIAKRIMYQRVDPDDTIVELWCRQNLHHYISSGDHGVDKLHDYWAQIQQKQTLTTEEQVLATLWLLGQSYHFEHQLEELLALLKKHNRTNPKDKVDLARVKKVFLTSNLKAYNEHKTDESRPTVEYCRLSERGVRRDWSKNGVTAAKKQRRKKKK